MKIAVNLGTESIARENLSEIRRIMDEARKALNNKGMYGYPVAVHWFQASIARELGFTPVTIFGPASPEASEFINISKSNVSLIMDNIHSPVGLPFKEVLPGVRYVQLLNFPGQKGTKTLTDVIRYNITQLIQD